jgi:diguanylate cyclase (GGDEF)-like protein
VNNRFINTLTSLVILALVSLVDFLQGHRLSLSIFYIAPIFLVTWYQGRIRGMVVSILCAIIWFLIEYYARPYDSQVWIMAANSVLGLGFFLLVNWLLSALHRAYIREQKMARHDPLTNAYNRLAFTELSEKVLESARSKPGPLALAYLDLDNFKQLNDTEGHAAGDRLLQLVVETISGYLHKRDILARLGGDEFAILLPGQAADEAKELLTRIQTTLLEKMRQRSWPVTFSIGIVCYSKTPAVMKEVIHEADMLMYEVKHSGKNHIKVLVH